MTLETIFSPEQQELQKTVLNVVRSEEGQAIIREAVKDTKADRPARSGSGRRVI